MSKILRYSEFFTTTDDNKVSNDFSYIGTTITLPGGNLIRFQDSISMADVTLDATEVYPPNYPDPADLQKYIQGWINEFKDRIEDEAGTVFLRETLEQIPVTGRLQNIGGDLYWEGEPVCVGDDCGGGGSVIPDGTIDRNILVWDDGGGEWVEYLSGGATMGPYEFDITAKTDNQNFVLKGIWSQGLPSSTSTSFCGIFNDDATGNLLGFRMGAAFYEVEGDYGSFVKGAAFGYHEGNGGGENAWTAYYNSASTDPRALGGQGISLMTSDSSTGTISQFLTLDSVDNPLIEGRIGNTSVPTNSTFTLSQDRSVNYRKFEASVINETIGPDTFFTKFVLEAQPGGANEFKVQLSEDTNDFVVAGSNAGTSLPTGGSPGCTFISSSDASVGSGVSRSVVVCCDVAEVIDQSSTLYSLGGLVKKTVVHESTPVNTGYAGTQVYLLDGEAILGIEWILPDAADWEMGRTWTVKNISETQTATISAANAANLVDNNSSYTDTLLANEFITYVKGSGTDKWHIINRG